MACVARPASGALSHIERTMRDYQWSGVKGIEPSFQSRASSRETVRNQQLAWSTNWKIRIPGLEFVGGRWASAFPSPNSTQFSDSSPFPWRIAYGFFLLSGNAE
jgi:hypothetical protein